MKGDLIYSLNYLADVRETKGDAWAQEPRDISGTEDSKGVRQILVIMRQMNQRCEKDPSSLKATGIVSVLGACWDLMSPTAASPHAGFQSSRASWGKSEEGAFVWHKQSSQVFQHME